MSELSVVSATVLTHSDDINWTVPWVKSCQSESPSGVNLHSLCVFSLVSNTAQSLLPGVSVHVRACGICIILPLHRIVFTDSRRALHDER